MRSTTVAYLLWALGFVLICGLHRFYTGRWITGFIWLLTGGLLLIGQIFDVFFVPSMVRGSLPDSPSQRRLRGGLCPA